jgi:hypothetical protein
MNPLLKLDGLDKLTKLSLKNALTNLFQVLTAEIYEMMDDLNESREDYHLTIHPFAIERVDGKPVPRHLLQAIQAKFQSDQRV